MDVWDEAGLEVTLSEVGLLESSIFSVRERVKLVFVGSQLV